MWQSETLQLCKLAQLVFGSHRFSNIDLVNLSIFKMLFHLFVLVMLSRVVDIRHLGFFPLKDNIRSKLKIYFPKILKWVYLSKKEI